jgi:ComEC/Rec2-related protein
VSPGNSGEVSPRLRFAAVPSLLLFATAAGSALLFYGFSFHHSADMIAGSLFLCSVPPLCAVVVSHYDGNKITRALVYILLCTSISIYLFHKTEKLIQYPPVISGSESIATVVSCDTGRYRDIIIVDLLPLRAPDIGTVRACMYIPHGTLNPGDTIAVNSAPVKIDDGDPLSDLRMRGVHYRVRAYARDYTVISRARPNLRIQLREAIIERNMTLYGKEAGPIVNALYLGDGYFTDNRTDYIFTRAGVLHILAASGSHVALVAGIPLFLLALIRIPSRVAYIIASLVLALYLYLSCAPVSLMRACIMFWVYALFRITGSPTTSLHALFLSGSIIIALSPWEIFSLGFRLSFCATLGIILFYRSFKNILPRIPFKISSSFALSLSAQIGVMPIIALSLSQVNCIGVFANIIIVPCIELMMVLSCVTGFASCVHSIFVYAAYPIRVGFEFILSLCEWFARLPGHFTFDTIPAWIILPFIALVCAPLVSTRKKTAKLLVIFAVLMPFVICRSLTINGKDHDTPVHLSVSNSTTVISGICSRETMMRAEREMRQFGFCIPDLRIDDSSPKSIVWNTRFIQKNPIRAVNIVAPDRLSYALRDLCNTLEMEGIALTFQNDIGPAHNKRKSISIKRPDTRL